MFYTNTCSPVKRATIPLRERIRLGKLADRLFKLAV